MIDKSEHFCGELSPTIIIDGVEIGGSNPTYFIADIAANHDGDIVRAKELIYSCKESGANAAKFQHFRAESIVSDYGFKSLGARKSHQSSWNKSVFDVYREATVSTDWTETLKETCNDAGITFFTSPYDFDLVDHIDPYVPAYKIGSGDITWIEIIEHIASKQKPYMLATGASTLQDVIRAVNAGLAINQRLCLMQCNTNYTGEISNMQYVNLNVLNRYRSLFPNVVLGLSDHTPGHSTVLGAVALGARVIEKHYTDDCSRSGPDHKFSMNPLSWREMVDRTRELEAALGGEYKTIEFNELETSVLQRRAICAAKNLRAGHILSKEDLIVLRPCPKDAFAPYQLPFVIGAILLNDKRKGEYLVSSDLYNK